MTDFALFWFISFIKIYSFWNINFFIQQHFYNSLGSKFFIMSITSSCHIKHKASIINIIYSNYCKFSKRFYFPITTITKFWSRFKTIVEIVVMTDFTLFWFISLIKIIFLESSILSCWVIFIFHTNAYLDKFVDTIFYLLQKKIQQLLSVLEILVLYSKANHHQYQLEFLSIFFIKKFCFTINICDFWFNPRPNFFIFVCWIKN